MIALNSYESFLSLLRSFLVFESCLFHQHLVSGQGLVIGTISWIVSWMVLVRELIAVVVCSAFWKVVGIGFELSFCRSLCLNAVQSVDLKL